MMRVIVRGLAVTVVVCLVTLAVGVSLALRSGATAFKVVDVSTPDHRWTPDQPLFIALLGNDARPGAGCGCADAVHVFGVPAGGGQGTMINIPRDTRVPIPGRGTTRINEMLQAGGAPAAARVLGSFLGVTINYVVITSFGGLTDMINEIGGVIVDVPFAMRDANSGANFTAGPNLMLGPQALAFARNRHLAGGDFTRSENQARLMIAVLARMRDEKSGVVDSMKQLVILGRHTELEGMGTTELFRLGRLALGIDTDQIRSVVMPGHTVNIGGASEVEADREAKDLFADFADDAVLQSH